MILNREPDPWGEEKLIKFVEFERYEYIAICMTPWHFLGVCSFINEREKKSGNRFDNNRCLMVILPHPYTGFCIHGEDLENSVNIPCDIIYGLQGFNTLKVGGLFFGLVNLFSYRKNKEIGGYFLSAALPMIFLEAKFFSIFKRKRKLVIVDEGVSGYLSPWGWMRHTFHETKSCKSALKMLFRHIVSHLMTSLFKAEPERWMLFQQRKRKFHLNVEISQAYFENFHVNLDGNKKTGRYVLLLSQPISDESEKVRYLYSIGLLIKEMKCLDIGFWVKLHPRDKKSDWIGLGECTIIDYQGPVETMYPTLEKLPMVVMGFSSSALLTLKAFYHAKCASISPYIRNATSTKLNIDEKFFIDSFGGEIDVIENLEGFSAFIKSIPGGEK